MKITLWSSKKLQIKVKDLKMLKLTVHLTNKPKFKNAANL